MNGRQLVIARIANPCRLGYVVPNYTISVPNRYCPSGRCYPINPRDLCDAYQPGCLPASNVVQPPLPCPSSDPRCPHGGFMVDPELPCHPFDQRCPSGSVQVNPVRCTANEPCHCPCDVTLPAWFKPCRAGTSSCPDGVKITDPITWPFGPTGPVPPGPVPGYRFDPTNFCNPRFTPHCDDRVVIDTNKRCDARHPGCIAATLINEPEPCNCPTDPACSLRGNCILVRPKTCNYNDPDPEPGCIKVHLPCHPVMSKLVYFNRAPRSPVCLEQKTVLRE